MDFLCPYSRDDIYNSSDHDEKLDNYIKNGITQEDRDSLNLRFKDVLKLGNIDNLKKSFLKISQFREIEEEYIDLFINDHIEKYILLLNEQNTDISDKHNPTLLFVLLTTDNFDYVDTFDLKDNESFPLILCDWMNCFVLQDNLDAIGVDDFIAFNIQMILLVNGHRKRGCEKFGIKEI